MFCFPMQRGWPERVAHNEIGKCLLDLWSKTVLVETIKVDKEALQFLGVLRGLCEFVLSGLWFPNPFSKDVFHFKILFFYFL